MQRNSAGQKIGAQMVSATDGSEFTGSVTVYVTGDAGTQAVGSVGSGACTHEGHGYHTYAPAQAETNYSLIAFTFTGTGAVPVTVQVATNTGPFESAGVASSRRLPVKSRGDGTYGVIGRVRMLPGETLWFAVDLAGAQLESGAVYAMSAPTVTGAQAANLTIPDYGVFGSLAKFQCVMSGSALTTDTINVALSISPESGETLLITVPVTVGS